MSNGPRSSAATRVRSTSSEQVDMTRHIVARTTDIPPGGNKVVGVEGRDIVVFHVNGEFFALLNRCPHAGAPLEKAACVARLTSREPGVYERSRVGELLRCAWHGWEFDMRGPAERHIRDTAVGLNFADIYNRSGVYPVQLPSGLGGEAAGVVEEVGAGVTDIKPGDRVAYGAAPIGAYAEARLIPADRLLKIPEGIDDKTAAAMMLKGLTTQYLIRQTYRVKSGDTILLHAAAGGVGLILSQWAKHLGATVIGTVGRDDKAKMAKAHGCAHTIVYSREDFVKRVEEITGGAKVPVVYDSVGKDTFLKSLDCLAPLGVAALFGASSGNVDPLNLGLLAQKGSLYVTRPTLNTYAAKRENLVAMANELFEVVKSGAVKIEVHQTYPLKDAAKAHADLAARKTTGSTVLTV